MPGALALLAGCSPVTLDYTTAGVGGPGSDPAWLDTAGLDSAADSAADSGADEAPNGDDDDGDGFVDEDFVAEGDVIINEVMPAPERGEEWLEIANVSGQAVDLSGWTLAGVGPAELTMADGLVLLPDELTVLDVSGLGDTADTLTLWLGERTIDALSYDAGWDLQPGASLSLDPSRQREADRSEAASWCAGTTPLEPGGRGSPGAPNDLCASLDHDGDGQSVDEGDCDDLDPAIFEGALEVQDWRDNDCDGLGDWITTAEAASHLDGGSAEYLGWRKAMTAGDFNGDGQLDVGLGGIYVGEYGEGGVFVLDGAGYAGWAGDIHAAAEATIDGQRAYGFNGAMGQRQGDQNGDGWDDLLSLGSDYEFYLGEGAGWLRYGGVEGVTREGGDSDIVFVNTRGWLGMVSAVSDADLDGDGMDDVIFSDWGDIPDEVGYVYLLSGAELAGGEIDVQSEEIPFLHGHRPGDYLGWSASAADVDGDGRDELFLAAPGVDAAAEDVGCVYRLDGGASIAGGVDVTSAASLSICGVHEDGRLGRNAVPQLADFDGDGRMDLAVSAPGVGQVYLFFDVALLSGEFSTLAADITLSSEAPRYFGDAMTVGDFDGDGRSDLVISAPDSNDIYTPPSESGRVYLFTGAALSERSASMGADSAQLTIQSGGLDHFGTALLAADLSGDGLHELLIAAPTWDSHRGRAWLFIMPAHGASAGTPVPTPSVPW